MYTTKDLENASKFARTNYRINLIRKLHEKQPQIASWLSYNIRDATQDDYYIPGALESVCKVIDIDITKEMCEMMSCTPAKEKQLCKETDEASYYHVGDDKYDVQCQPACFNATAVPATSNGVRVSDMPEMAWNDNAKKCRIVNSNVKAYLEKPFYRSEVEYETRVNDFAIGFNRIDDPNDINGPGYTYTNNETYCTYFDKVFNQATKECEQSTGDFIAGAIIGGSLINTMRSAIRVLRTGVAFPEPENLPTLPDKMEERFTRDGWRKNINTNFILPQPIDTTPKPYNTTRTKRSYHDDEKLNKLITSRRRAEMLNTNYSGFTLHHMRKKTPSYVYTEDDLIPGTHQSRYIENDLEPTFTKPSEMNNFDNLIDDCFNETHARLKRNATEKQQQQQKKQEKTNTTTTAATTKKEKAIDVTKKVLVGILQTITTDPNFYYDLNIALTFDAGLLAFRKVALKLVASLSSQSGKALIKIVGSVGTNVLSNALKDTMARSVATNLTSLAFKAIALTAKLASMAATVVGIILIIVAVMDIVLSAWDPYGYNSMLPANYPKDMFYFGQVSLRQQLGTTADVTFELIALKLLTKDELGQLELNTIIDKVIYLDALVVNAEGTRIDKGEPVNVVWTDEDELSKDQKLQEAYREAQITGTQWNAITFEQYNRKFTKRTEAVKYLNYGATVGLILSAVFYFSRLPLIAIVCLLIAIILFTVSLFSIDNDLLTNFIDKYSYSNSDGSFSGYPST
jgi:hypothetical protein